MKVEEVWKWLNEYNSRFVKQRAEVFNFSLVLFGLLTNAIVSIIVKIGEIETYYYRIFCCVLLISLGLFMICISILFIFVDNRTMSFVNETREELVKCEKLIEIPSPEKIERANLVYIKLPYTIELKKMLKRR